MFELEKLNAYQIGKLVNTKQITPKEVLQYFEKRINERNKDLNAITYTKFEEAYIEAEKLEKRINNGEYVGPFAGVPFLLKDFLPSKKGWTNTHGGVKSLEMVDPYDSEFCIAMEKAGGIAVGKSNAPSYGFRGTCDNKLYGPTKNPFNLKYNSGGSSGGSASAVSAGLVPIAEGGDAGGSIRIPAAWCNLYGFKASFGLIPNICRPDAFSATHPYCTGGALTKSVKDSAILLNYMARFDSSDPLSIKLENIDYVKELNKSVKGLKIGYTKDFGIFEVDEEIHNKVFETAKKLEKLGALVEEIKFDINYSANDLADMWSKSIMVDSAIEFELNNNFEKIKKDLPKEVIAWYKKAKNMKLMDYYKFNLIKTNLYDAFRKVFDKYDLIISPTTSILPVLNTKNTKGPKQINGKEINELIGFTQTFIINFLGLPACSIPAGLSNNKLPIGMQIIGKKYEDNLVLRLSHKLEILNPWKKYYKISFNEKCK